MLRLRSALIDKTVRRQNEREALGASGSDSAAEVQQTRVDERLDQPRAERGSGRAHALLKPEPPVLDEYDRDEHHRRVPHEHEHEHEYKYPHEHEHHRRVPHEHQTSIMTEDGEIQDVEWHGDTEGEEREGEEREGTSAPEPYALDSDSSDSRQEECEMCAEG